MQAVCPVRDAPESPLAAEVGEVVSLLRARAAIVFLGFATPTVLASHGNPRNHDVGSGLGLNPKQYCILKETIPGTHGEEPLGTVVLAVDRSRARELSIQTGLRLLAGIASREIQLQERTRTLRRAKALSARHVELREFERQRLSTQIHNGLSQSITLMRLGLAAMQLRSGASPDLTGLVAIASQISDMAIDLMNGPDTAPVETLGLAVAIRQEAMLRQRETGVAVRCDLREVSLPRMAAIAAFRIFQEGLANAARHARSPRIEIRLWKDPAGAHLSIRDEGRGFRMEAVRHSLGLASMFELAEIAKGELSVESAPGSGTRILASFPLPEARSGAQ